MSTIAKFEQIIRWYAASGADIGCALVAVKSPERIADIENLLGEPLPPELVELFASYGGASTGNNAAFIGHGVMTVERVIASLEFSKDLIKPPDPYVDDPERSETIIDAIASIHRAEIERLGCARRSDGRWHKLTLDCSADSYGGPYFFQQARTSEEECIILDVQPDRQSEVMELAAKLHKLEYETYRWDELEFAIFGDGTTKVKRTFYNFDRELDITSYPTRAIRKKYFHIKWLPVIEDHGGNYIGIDFDPGQRGKKAQVIVFGRDDVDMYVIADSWDEFLDRIIEATESRPEELLADCHLHDIFRPVESRSL
ncbi:SMI1/KNR4 family protein [Sphingomonas sp. SUN039]|uniref:SMI1/KNR4 family protein n=1 Tax=Sphingomonas sp. SUN039 TaxID=2937787 RepID=UPI0021647794|nr:SMI1/KNR4 family protein [Sphingomonas sp. SUN039]UVO55073.1 SMI1/KNR4 family protein [Sphingomonas sp. SUN039]